MLILNKSSAKDRPIKSFKLYFHFYFSTQNYLLCLYFIINFKMSEILTAVKWTDLIAQIEPNCEANFPIAKKMSVRTVISGYMADEYPGRTFKTWVNKKDQVITVYRTA